MVQKNDTPALDDLGDLEGGISADDVTAYLEGHPDFFASRQDLLANMTAPSRWTGDGVVDMQHFLADRRLREIDDLRGCAQEVIETSRSNMSVQTRTHAAVLALLWASDMGELLRVISDDLPLLLDVDVVILGFETPGLETSVAMSSDVDIRLLGLGDVDRILGADENIVLLRDLGEGGGDEYGLFGAASGLVRTAGLARLCPGQGVPLGYMGLGSRGETFSPGQGTELIGFLARAMETCLHRAAGNEG
ncbi:MAG: DUF484 family protein [Alphaproteobacteria bacterium]|jgi:uncharacterized protein|nr:DUF484 family protein [Alphaproteobacteria bacterium]MBT7942344.1 DUF484 family protein [Alphaproteobacteria bacterium]